MGFIGGPKRPSGYVAHDEGRLACGIYTQIGSRVRMRDLYAGHIPVSSSVLNPAYAAQRILMNCDTKAQRIGADKICADPRCAGSASERGRLTTCYFRLR